MIWSYFQTDTGRAYAWDLFGYHFYLNQGSPVSTNELQNYFNNVRGTQAANGDNSDVSVTEWGWQTVGTNTQELQRDNMASGYDFMESQSYIESTYWYQWLDEPAGNWGVNSISGTPKLSYYELTNRNAPDPTIPGDFDLDGTLDADDIDMLFDHFGNAAYDLNDDGSTNNLDVIHLVRVMLNTEYGDANLDGKVDIHDYNQLALAYGTDGGWAGGDFTGNDIVNDSDLNVLKLFFGFQTPPPSTPIPEPTSAGILALLTLLTTRTRRH